MSLVLLSTGVDVLLVQRFCFLLFDFRIALQCRTEYYYICTL